MILNAFNKAYHAAFSSVECATSGILQVTWHGKIAVKDFFFYRVLNWIKESWQPYYESSLRILEYTVTIHGWEMFVVNIISVPKILNNSECYALLYFFQKLCH